MPKAMREDAGPAARFSLAECCMNYGKTKQKRFAGAFPHAALFPTR